MNDIIKRTIVRFINIMDDIILKIRNKVYINIISVIELSPPG